MTKPCAKCRVEKPDVDFHLAGRRGRHSWCRDCFNSNAREHRNRKVTPEQRRVNNLWTRYRLRPDDVAGMFDAQNGLCAICGSVPARPVVDHCHNSGRVRGILCHPCNIILPAAEDAAWLDRAHQYLARAK